MGRVKEFIVILRAKVNPSFSYPRDQKDEYLKYVIKCEQRENYGDIFCEQRKNYGDIFSYVNRQSKNMPPIIGQLNVFFDREGILGVGSKLSRRRLALKRICPVLIPKELFN